MNNRLFSRIVDMRRSDSLITRLRQQRIAAFRARLQTLPTPIRLLDVGGTPFFWQMLGIEASAQLQITCINPIAAATSNEWTTALVGDGCAMPQFADREFDMVFSNSVIEHVGTWARQQQMAAEIRRVGRRYFVQTPDRYVALEPHFVVPGFQFLPLGIRVLLLQRFALGWYARTPDPRAAHAEVAAIRLLSAREMRQLFPGSVLQRERLGPLPVSLIAVG